MAILLGAPLAIIAICKPLSEEQLKSRLKKLEAENPWLKDTEKLENDSTQCRALCCGSRGGPEKILSSIWVAVILPQGGK